MTPAVTPAVTPQWLTLFLDLPPEEHERAVLFWRDVTGYELSEPRGEAGEFATLLPPEGDPHLKVQRTLDGPAGVHLDLHVDAGDLDDAVRRAVALGARLLARQGHAVLASPGGFRLCLVQERHRRPASPTRWPDGHRSLVDQVAIDVPAPLWERETTFWAELTGWPLQSTGEPEFLRLAVPGALPLRILLQRLEDGADAVTGHIDLAATDRTAEVERHLKLGAAVEHPGRGWVVMAPPAGPTYCITERHPEERLLT